MTGTLGPLHPENWVNPVSGRTYAGGAESQDLSRDYPAPELIGRRPATGALNPSQFGAATARTPTQAEVVDALNATGGVIQRAQQGLRAARAQNGQAVTQGTQQRTAASRAASGERNAAFAGMLAQVKQTAIPQAAAPPAAPPASPPAPPGSPPGGAGGLSSGPFGPGHPFYAALTPAKPTSYPTVGRPDMPTAAPTAGLDTSQRFLASPGGKLVASSQIKLLDAAGKALGEAAKPRKSAQPAYTNSSGWRTN